MLFGLDVLDEFLLNEQRPSNDKTIQTVFGWSVGGKCLPETSVQSAHLCYQSLKPESTTNELLSAFWKTEQPPSDISLESDEECQALSNFTQTNYRVDGGRYVVRLHKKNVSLSLGCYRD